MKNEQNEKMKYESPEIRLSLRQFADFLDFSGNKSEAFDNDPFESGFGSNFS